MMNSKLLIIFFVLTLSACGGENLNSQKPSYAPAPDIALQAVSPQTIIFLGKRSEFTIKKIADGLDVSHKDTGVSQRIVGTPSLRFNDVIVNLAVATSSTSIAAADLINLVELYVAFFNRVPDADGLNYWIGQRRSGASIDDIANSFYAAAIQYPQLTGYSHSMTNTDFVRIIYKNVLGRETVDQSGLDYWRAQLESKAATRASLIQSILTSAHSFKGNVTWGWVADLLDNKVLVSKYFALDLGLSYLTGEDNVAKGIAIARAVSSTSLEAAKEVIGIYDEGYYLKLATANSSLVANGLAQLNAQGALGFLYLGDYVFSDGTYSQYSKNLMQPTTYSYELRPFSTTAANSLEILNTAGRKGYYFFAPYYFNEGIHALFIHSHADARNFAYKALAVVASSVDFLAQANAEGKLGYRYIGQYQFSDGVKALFMSDGTQSSTLVYEVLKSKTIPSAFEEKANELGTLGFRFTSDHIFSDGSFSIYIKDSARSDSFNFTLKPIVGLMQNSTAYLQDVNAAGGQRKRLLGIRVFLADQSLSQSYVFIGGSDYTQYSPFGM